MYKRQAQAVAQAEALFFQRAGNPQGAVMLGDNSARQYAGVKERINVADGEHPVVMIGTEDRHLLLTEQGADAGGGQDVVNFADVYPCLLYTSRCV